MILGGSPLGFILIAIAIAFAFFKVVKVISDEQIEEEYKLFAEANFSTAMEDGGFTEEDLVQTPDWFWYVTRDSLKDSKKKWRKGKDKLTRSNTRGIVIINYGKDQIFFWDQIHNIETNKHSPTDTSEYFYEDVVAMEVSQNDGTINLRTKGGDKTYMIASKVNDESGGEERGKITVTTVRRMVRERKKQS